MASGCKSPTHSGKYKIGIPFCEWASVHGGDFYEMHRYTCKQTSRKGSNGHFPDTRDLVVVFPGEFAFAADTSLGTFHKGPFLLFLAKPYGNRSWFSGSWTLVVFSADKMYQITRKECFKILLGVFCFHARLCSASRKSSNFPFTCFMFNRCSSFCSW